MMPAFTTPVETPQMPFIVDFSSGIISLGSCFADEIGKRLQEGGFNIELNPFGALYNPASIASAMQRIIDDKPIGMGDLVEQDGLWHSWHHHGSFSQATPDATLEACNSRIHQAHNALKKASLLMITFGTAYIYEYEGCVVANCHKVPNNRFARCRMTVDEIVALWTPLIEKLNTQYPTLNIVFTVSPIRHLADGAHGNQLSKSTLLLAVDQLITQTINQSIHYFPSYEIVLDELRDYRFFGLDMTHPTELAVDVVWEHFQRATMRPAVCEQARVNAKQAKRDKHIPLH